MTGKIMFGRAPPFQPPLGNHCRVEPNNRINKGAVTKVGTQTPSTARPMAPMSRSPFRRRAARMPRLTPVARARTRAARPRRRLTGAFWDRMSATDLSGYFREGPKSPCTTPLR